MRLPALTTLIFLPLMLFVLNAATAKVAIFLLVPTYMLALAYTGPTWAILQTVSPLNMRALAAAILLFLVNFIGLGMGPQSIGILSDILQSGAGTSGLRFAIGCCWCGQLGRKFLLLSGVKINERRYLVMPKSSYFACFV